MGKLTSLDKTYMTTPLTEHAFVEDNKKVQQYLNILTVNDPTWTFINQHECKFDFHGAWKYLVVHYKGYLQIARANIAAYNKITFSAYNNLKSILPVQSKI